MTTTTQDRTIRRLSREGNSAHDIAGILDLDVQDVIDTLEDWDCEGHESTDGPIGNVVYCDGSCLG